MIMAAELGFVSTRSWRSFGIVIIRVRTGGMRFIWLYNIPSTSSMMLDIIHISHLS
ncbi:unnamed protein product [Linum tenue]|uniref:Cytochrome c oxidase subunit 1 n=1 Tax=Linum tenue TaxID=586396 RepID=A0AAV0M6J6_9ROSI|nr:unnamed protein product [Linum tenue]